VLTVRSSPHAPVWFARTVAATIVGCPWASVIGPAGSPLAGGTGNGLAAVTVPELTVVAEPGEPWPVRPWV